MLSFRFPITAPSPTLPPIAQHKVFTTISNPLSQSKANASNIMHNSFSLPKSWKILASNSNVVIEGSSKETVAEQSLLGGLQPALMPKHVAVIMDGNRRWASERGLAVEDAHRAGARKTKEIAVLCCELGIKVLTVFAFSTENWVSPREEVDILTSLYEEIAESNLEEAMRYGVRVSVIGDTSKLPKSLKRWIALGDRTTKANEGLQLMVALNYSGRQDILQATRKIASKLKDGNMLLEDIDDRLFEKELQTNCSELPNPDLLIRTSGEKRVSNFMLWQLAYTELFFVNKSYSDFEEADFREAISSFQRRQRKFGGHKY